MILRELYELYSRLLEAGEEVPPMGRSLLSVSFRIVLKPSGELVRIEDARRKERIEKRGKKGVVTVTEKMVPTRCQLLGEPKPSGQGLNPCFLWDNAEYLLGYVGEGSQRKRATFESFRDKHLAQEALIGHPCYSAVCRFLENWEPERLTDYVADAGMLTHNGVFQIQGEFEDVHEVPELCRWWDEGGSRYWWGEEVPEEGRCLVTNEKAPIARVHKPVIRGVKDAQPTGAKIVSFNCDAFESYGCAQSGNAPVSEAVAFGYCNALNYLLARQGNRVFLGESTVVFWSAAPRADAVFMEMLVLGMMNPQELEAPAAQDAALVEQICGGLRLLARGKMPSAVLSLPQETRFFILGLSPNSARLSVRFYRESSFGEFVQHLQSHYAGMELVKRGESFHDPEVISPFMILQASVRDVSKELPPATTGHLMNAIIGGTPYPEMLAMSILRRFKADDNINFIRYAYIRCAYLKAWLVRNHNLNLKPMLDTTNTQPGYLLGRLFAALVKTQEDALGENLNRDMRQSYYSSASATPRSVFPRLLRLYTHHLGKLKGGRKVNREKTVQEIMSSLSSFPAHLTLAEQGAFGIGYYHQMQSFYAPCAPASDKQEKQSLLFNLN